MNISKPIYADLEFEQIYHLFTRVSGHEYIFRKEENYSYFLKKFAEYLLPYLEVFAYCLVPQKFNILVCFRPQKEICSRLQIQFKELSKEQEHKFLMQPISNFLNSYAKSFNKVFNRKGALFIDYIKREKLDDEESLKKTFRNIHQMPIFHKIVDQPEDWKFSSFKSYIKHDKPSKVSRNFMSDFFHDTNDLLNYHLRFD